MKIVTALFFTVLSTPTLDSSLPVITYFVVADGSSQSAPTPIPQTPMASINSPDIPGTTPVSSPIQLPKVDFSNNIPVRINETDRFLRLSSAAYPTIQIFYSTISFSLLNFV